MTNGDFSQRQQKAIEEMLKMKDQSQYKSKSPQPEKPKPQPPQSQNDLLGGLNIPLLSSLKTDSDLTLIIGLLLLLLNEKADKRLLFALLYILL